MPIITFVNSKKEETGKTLSLVAIATNMAIEYNTKILLISTTNRDDKINSSFIDTRIKKLHEGLADGTKLDGIILAAAGLKRADVLSDIVENQLG